MAKSKDGDGLTDLQRKFVEAYLIKPVAKEAAVTAGYSPKNAEQIGYQLLQKTSVAEAIARGRLASQKRTGITADRTLREIAALAYLDPADILDFTGETPRLKPANQIPRRARKAIASIKVKRVIDGAKVGGDSGIEAREAEIIEFKFWDKNAALEKLAKQQGLYEGDPEEDGAKRHVKVYVATEGQQTVIEVV